MRVQATKTMARAINDFFRTSDKFKKYTATAEKRVDLWGDEKSFITIFYPAEFYAFPRDLYDGDLLRIFRHSDGSLAGFMDALADEIEI